MNTNNATLNDAQTTALNDLDNLFDKVNHVCCFNHTVQLSAKTSIKLFNTGMGENMVCSNDNNESSSNHDDNMPALEDLEDEDNDEAENKDTDANDGVSSEGGDIKENIDELDELSKDECAQVLEDTVAV
jgi:hypothetical protein